MSTNMHKNDSKKVMQGCARLREVAQEWGGGAPYNQIIQTSQGVIMGPETLHIEH